MARTYEFKFGVGDWVMVQVGKESIRAIVDTCSWGAPGIPYYRVHYMDKMGRLHSAWTMEHELVADPDQPPGR